MTSSQSVVLDIGSTKVAALAGELDATGSVKVLGFAIEPHDGVRKGSIVDAEVVAHAAGAALSRVEATSGLKGTPVVFGIGGRQGQPTIGQGLVPIFPSSRSITREDVLQVVNHSRQVTLPDGRELVQAIPAEFRIDGRTAKKSPLGKSGSRLEVSTLLIGVEGSQIELLERVAETGGRTIDQFVYEPVASGLGVLTSHQMEYGSIVVDIGGDSTAVGAFEGGTAIFADSIPLGSKHVTADVSKLLKVSPEEAEVLKVSAGCAIAAMVPENESISVLQMGQIERRSMQRKVFCEIVEARMREIAKMVREALERGGCLDRAPGGLAVTGGGSQMKGITELFETTIPGVKAKPTVPHFRGHHAAEASRPEMATCAGLVRYAVESCSDDLSPAVSDGTWGERIRTLMSLLGRKA